ncbi:MAG TPA: ACT domain-containing protein [Myxococcota bacterium]|nr:ACT domain-containing protein [Myxococcota bacterium]
MDLHQKTALAEQIVRAVQARLGQQDPRTVRLIAEEVAAALDAAAGAGAGPGGSSLSGSSPSAVGLTDSLQAGAVQSGLPPATPMPAQMAGGVDEPHPSERIVVSANGRNQSGIVAKLTAIIHDFKGDIRDISQTLVGDYFTMIIVVDIAGATRQGKHFSQLKEGLQGAGQEIGVHVVALHDDLLSSMHSV